MLKEKTKKKIRVLLNILFGAYILLMLWLLYGQRIGDAPRGNINLMPFVTVKEFIEIIKVSSNSAAINHAVVNLLGNIIMFVPLGFFLCCTVEKCRRLWVNVLFTVGIILIVEIIQLVTKLGHCDIDDLMLNVFGSIVGFFVFKLVNKLKIYI